MRITTSQYAKTLYELTKDKSDLEVNNIIAYFLKVLVKNRQMKLAAKIKERFADIFNKEQGIVEAEIITREKLSEHLRKEVSNYVSNKYSAKEVVIKNKIDLDIKGGIVIKVGDEVLDASVARQLQELRSSLEK